MNPKKNITKTSKNRVLRFAVGGALALGSIGSLGCGGPEEPTANMAHDETQHETSNMEDHMDHEEHSNVAPEEEHSNVAHEDDLPSVEDTEDDMEDEVMD